MADGPIEEPTPLPVEGETPLAEAPVEEEAIAEEVLPVAGAIDVSVQDFPDLSTKNVGDPVTLEVQKISDDGNIITLIPSSVPEAAASPGGQEEIASELLGAIGPGPGAPGGA